MDPLGDHHYGRPVRPRSSVPTRHPAGALSPAVAAIIVRKWVTREGFSDAGLRLNRHHWRYYLAALVLPLLGGHHDRALSHNSGHKRPRLLPETRNMATRATRNRCSASSRRHLRPRGLPVDDHRPTGDTHSLWRGIRVARLPPTPTPRRPTLDSPPSPPASYGRSGTFP